MNRMQQTRVTRKMKAVDANLVEVTCCEKNCGMSILVDKAECAQGRQIRCVSCMMRAKMERQ